jgi:hypothetical protein
LHSRSISKAVRQSLIRQRDAEIGLSAQRRCQRAQTLRRLLELFQGSDPAAERRRLKNEGLGF